MWILTISARFPSASEATNPAPGSLCFQLARKTPQDPRNPIQGPCGEWCQIACGRDAKIPSTQTWWLYRAGLGQKLMSQLASFCPCRQQGHRQALLLALETLSMSPSSSFSMGLFMEPDWCFGGDQTLASAFREGMILQNWESQRLSWHVIYYLNIKPLYTCSGFFYSSQCCASVDLKSGRIQKSNEMEINLSWDILFVMWW